MSLPPIEKSVTVALPQAEAFSLIVVRYSAICCA